MHVTSIAVLHVTRAARGIARSEPLPPESLKSISHHQVEYKCSGRVVEDTQKKLKVVSLVTAGSHLSNQLSSQVRCIRTTCGRCHVLRQVT